MSVKQNLFVSVFVHECLMMLNDVEYTTFKMFVTQMRDCYSFQLMFYETLRYRLARAQQSIPKIKLFRNLNFENEAGPDVLQSGLQHTCTMREYQRHDAQVT